MVASSRGKTIYLGVLTQRSALSIGGSNERGAIDDPFCRDGLSRPTLRGTGLAGAFFATLRKCGLPVPRAMSQGLDEDRGRETAPDKDWYGESLLRFWNTHPEPCWHGGGRSPSMEPRQGVGIRQDTGASAHGALYDLESTPIGGRWPLVIEFDTWRIATLPEELKAELAAANAECLVDAVLAEWKRERLWIGRGVARGLGWMRLDELHTYHLAKGEVRDWPNKWLYVNPTDASPRRPFNDFAKELTKSEATVIEADSAPRPSLKSQPWHYLRLRGTARAGVRNDGYGLNSLSIGGHDAHLFKGAYQSKHTHRPSGMKEADYEREVFTPDTSIVMSEVRRNGHAAWEPIIPGSSIRGPLRHTLSRDLRRHGTPVRDPLTNRDYRPPGSPPPANSPDWVEPAFGAPPGRAHARSSIVLVCDAYLTEASAKDWKMALLQRHAEDEFTAGVYTDSKFNRLALLHGKFAWEIVIEAPMHAEACAVAKEIIARIKQRDGRDFPIGGGQWRGHGWLEWQVNTPQEAQAGKDWKDVADQDQEIGQ